MNFERTFQTFGWINVQCLCVCACVYSNLFIIIMIYLSVTDDLFYNISNEQLIV